MLFYSEFSCTKTLLNAFVMSFRAAMSVVFVSGLFHGSRCFSLFFFAG